MTTPAAFRGLFRAFDPGSSAGGARLTIGVDRAQLGHILVRLGTPAVPIDEQEFSVAIAPCAFPRHPTRDGEVIGAALILALITMLQSGELPLTPQIALQLDALRELQTGRPVTFTPPNQSRPATEGDDGRE